MLKFELLICWKVMTQEICQMSRMCVTFCYKKAGRLNTADNHCGEQVRQNFKDVLAGIGGNEIMPAEVHNYSRLCRRSSL